MQMIQRSFYVEPDIYQQVMQMAKMRDVPAAELIREMIRVGVKKSFKKKSDPGTNFLLKLGKYGLKKGPKDLAKKHDKYTWE